MRNEETDRYHKQTVASRQNTKERKYWLELLSGDLEKTVFPPDHTVKAPGAKPVASIEFKFPPHQYKKLMKLRNQSDSRLFMILTAGLTVLLNKYTLNNHILLGTPVIKQKEAAQFINTILVLRTVILEEMTFKDILMKVRQTLLEATENQNYPIETLPRQLNIIQSREDDFPLFDIALMLDNIHDRTYIEHLKFNMFFIFTRTDHPLGEIRGVVHYSRALYEKGTIQRIVTHYLRIFQVALADVNITSGEIEILTSQEKEQLLNHFNGPLREYHAETTIHRLFEEQVEKTPGAKAVGYSIEPSQEQSGIVTKELTYHQLNNWTNQVANRLISVGVTAETIVGIIVKSSAAVSAAILGTLKAGGTYLPIDPEYPSERIDYILVDSSIHVSITDCGYDSLLEVADIIEIDVYAPSDQQVANPLDRTTPANAAYIIYTSGTTGRPKGVVLEHQSVVNTLICRKEEYGLAPGDCALQLFSYAFDGFVTSFFTPIISGASVVFLTRDAARDMGLIKQSILSHNVTHFISVPSLFHAILQTLEQEDLVFLKVVTLAGEQLPPNIIEMAHQKKTHLEIAHEYGVTEASVMSTLYRHQEKYPQIKIGKPTWNTLIYILGQGKRSQPLNVPGELCIGGYGLARGYLNRPQLTAEKFISPHRDYMVYTSNKFYTSYSTKLYKTGDRARWLKDGNIDFLGRIDHQIKIRGYRIEPGEIENRLLQHPRIKEALVIPIKDNRGEQCLCAYIIASEEIEESQLRQFLVERLPDYMIPVFFEFIDVFPKTPNGKIDRRALPAPDIKGTGKDFIAPRNKTETALAKIWTDILELEKTPIGIDADFFEQGGYSIKATQLVNKIHKKFNIKIPLEEIFKHPTIRGLAETIDTLGAQRFIPLAPVEKRTHYPLSSAQKRLYIIQTSKPSHTNYNGPIAMQLTGEPNVPRFRDAFKELVRRHENLRTSYHQVNGQPVQRIHSEVEFDIQYHPRGSIRETSPEKIIQSFICPFDLSIPPLIRVALMEIAPQKHLFLVDMHHIVGDRASNILLKNEFLKLYSGQDLPPLRLHYKDYALWQSKRKETMALQSQEDYWLKRFAGELPQLELPADYDRPQIWSFSGHQVQFQIGTSQVEALNTLAASEGVTFFMLLFTIYTVLLSKLSGQQDIIVGIPSNGRVHADIEHIIGMFVNTLALRNYPQPGKPFNRFLAEVKQNTLEDFENQEYQFEELVEKAALQRDTNHNPIFDVMFQFENITSQAIEMPGITVEPLDFTDNTSKFDINLICTQKGDELSFVVVYSTELFCRETIRQWFVRYFKDIVASVLQNPRRTLAQIDILSHEEEGQMISQFTDSLEDE